MHERWERRLAVASGFEATLLGGLEPGPTTADDKAANDALVRDVLHQNLFESGITILHKPRTGNGHEVPGGIANDVVTKYVEHAFLVWLLRTQHQVRLPAIPDTANCKSPDIDPELFFDAAPEESDFLDAEFDGDEPVSSEARAKGAEYVAAIARDIDRCAKAKAVCGDCVFSLECLTESIVQNDVEGVWGGLDKKERHLMLNRFQALRRSYKNGNMPKSMRSDMESHARQIAAQIALSARAQRETSVSA